MPLERSQLIRLQLAGTVALPSPYPTIGAVTREAEPISYKGGRTSDEHVVYITHEDGHARTVTWCVSTSDIVALEEKNNLAADSNWHLGPEVVDAIDPDETVNGILYIRETAQVLLRTEVGLSALDSADVRVVSQEAFRSSPSSATGGARPAIRAQQCCPDT